MAQVNLCDMCNATIKDDDEAGSLHILPPIPAELQKYRDNPQAMLTNTTTEEKLVLLKATSNHKQATERFEFCAECAGFLRNTVRQMKELKAGVDAGTLKVQ